MLSNYKNTPHPELVFRVTSKKIRCEMLNQVQHDDFE